MKSVLSYIGDLVYPTRGLEGTIGFPKRGERDYINTEKYQQAVSEVTSLWSPLVGMFVPNKNKSTTNKLRKNMNPTTPDPKEVCVYRIEVFIVSFRCTVLTKATIPFQLNTKCKNLLFGLCTIRVTVASTLIPCSHTGHHPQYLLNFHLL